VEHAATVTMQIADTYVTRCRRPAVAHTAHIGRLTPYVVFCKHIYKRRHCEGAFPSHWSGLPPLPRKFL